MSGLAYTKGLSSTHDVIILTKFHEQRAKIVDLLLMVNLGMCAVFFYSVFMYPAGYHNLREFFGFHLELSQNWEKQIDVQKILSNCSCQQGTFLKLRQGQPMSDEK